MNILEGKCLIASDREGQSADGLPAFESDRGDRSGRRNVNFPFSSRAPAEGAMSVPALEMRSITSLSGTTLSFQLFIGCDERSSGHELVVDVIPGSVVGSGVSHLKAAFERNRAPDEIGTLRRSPGFVQRRGERS